MGALSQVQLRKTACAVADKFRAIHYAGKDVCSQKDVSERYRKAFRTGPRDALREEAVATRNKVSDVCVPTEGSGQDNAKVAIGRHNWERLARKTNSARRP